MTKNSYFNKYKRCFLFISAVNKFEIGVTHLFLVFVFVKADLHKLVWSPDIHIHQKISLTLLTGLKQSLKMSSQI